MRMNSTARLIAAGLILLACARADADSATAAGVQPFGPAVLVEGSPRECGKTYGGRFRDEIRSFYKTEIVDAFVGKPSSKAQLLAYAQACGKVLQSECSVIAEEFLGIADGAGLDFEEIVLINLHEELYHRAELPAKHGHCTAVAVGPPDTGSERAFVGQTWDWMQSVAGKSAVVEWRRANAPAVLAYGFPGMPTGAGLNSQGIALCWTSAALGEDKGLPPRVGIPSYALIAHLLSQPDMDAVIREARKDRHAGWFTFVMSDAAGNLVNIEGSPRGVEVHRTTRRLVRVGYGTATMTGTASGADVPLHDRCQKLYGLLDATAGRNDLPRLQSYLGEPTYGINVGKSTIDMMVFDTTARAAHLSRGTSYAPGWRKYSFSKSMAPRRIK
jgi:isopenicillin-N N-acyltransferase-like protein